MTYVQMQRPLGLSSFAWDRGHCICICICILGVWASQHAAAQRSWHRNAPKSVRCWQSWRRCNASIYLRTLMIPARARQAAGGKSCGHLICAPVFPSPGRRCPLPCEKKASWSAETRETHGPHVKKRYHAFAGRARVALSAFLHVCPVRLWYRSIILEFFMICTR